MASDIVMVQEEFDDVTSSLSTNSVDFLNTEEKMGRDFFGANEVGLLGSSADKIEDQMYSVSNSIDNVQSIIKEHSVKFFTYDDYLVEKINEIVIPEDFLINNPLKINYYTQVILGKSDGESVNNGASAQKTDDTFDSSVSAAVVKDISGDEVFEDKYDEASVIDSKEQLYGLTDQPNAYLTNYDEISNIDSQEMLSEVNDGASAYIANINDDSLVNKETLTEVMNEVSDNAAINNLEDYFEEANEDNVSLSKLNQYYDEVEFNEDYLDKQ